MLVIRVCGYAVLLYLLSFYELSEFHLNVVWTTFIMMLYIDAKHPDIRSLIVIFAVINTFFVELDIFVFILTSYYWDTGLVIGDLILNGIILLNLLAMAIAIYYRPEIMNYVQKKFDMGDHMYLYTVADFVQLKFIQLIIVFAAAYTIYMFYLALLVWGVPDGKEHAIEYETARSFYKAKSYIFVDALVKVEAARNFLLVLVLFKWLRKSMDSKTGGIF
ncbi:hypothetical protein [Paraglaciecola sp. 20A4]|uniref:hypothetical protein n=1 Tax=Paraglaciecola sp. 20A4 TaxID=2687288 RepID=UPI00140D4BB8|nr:hypothetical protein [Paraglaciecola sp. 20A4]